MVLAEVVEMTDKTTFGKFIRQKRIEKNLTQKELADILFLSESAVSKWEMGKSYPDITLIPDLCKALDVSERELIGGANDTQYRKLKEDARLYHRITETFFWGFTGAYLLALVVCLICDLAIHKRLTFFPIVFASLLTAFTFIPTCVRFTKKHKLALFAGSTYLSMTILFLTCCVCLHQNWFGNAAMGTLLGYAVVFGPFLLKKYARERLGKWTLPVYFAVCCAVLFLLLPVVRMYTPFSIANASLITLYGAIPFAVIALMHVLPCNRLFKAAVDVFVTGGTVYGGQYVINKILGVDRSADYVINFFDWAHCTNGNVYIILLSVCTALSVVLAIAGIVRKRKS